MTQEGMVLKMLKKAGKHGIENHKFPAARILCYTKIISNLRKEGHHITKERIWVNGRGTNTFRYFLEQPEKKEWWKR